MELGTQGFVVSCEVRVDFKRQFRVVLGGRVWVGLGWVVTLVVGVVVGVLG